MTLAAIVSKISVAGVHETRDHPVIRFVELHVDGDPEPLEHSQLGWFTPSELQDMPLAPSDAAFVRWVRDRTG